MPECLERRPPVQFIERAVERKDHIVVDSFIEKIWCRQLEKKNALEISASLAEEESKSARLVNKIA